MAGTQTVASKIELFGANNDGQVVQYAYSGTGMCTKGEVMALSGTSTDLRYVTQSRAKADTIAGIASQDCSGTDVGGANSLSVGLWTQGIFEGVISGTSIKPGDRLVSNCVTGSHNQLMVATAAQSASGAPVVVGYTVQGGNANGVGAFRLNL